MVCDKVGCVTKLGVTKVRVENVVRSRWCVTKICVKDCVSV